MNRKDFFKQSRAASPAIVEIQQLRSLSIDQLIARYISEFSRPPKAKQKEFLWKRISWKIQERRLGGLSNVAKAHLEHLISQIELPPRESLRTISGKLKIKPVPNAPTTGSVLTREWRGKTYHVRLQSDGTYLIEETGVPYKSLSAAAFGITNSKWNGRLFFNLVERKPAVRKVVAL